ncbi:hypothetical protein TIFTF001_026888 [Ficus carica]|uniref:Uncharacterized protein n=1 Tax=Ficus carica TaxID=3494 RepID=A0AA88DMZ9_FICCA|nr:hypothetical protein TIFTF001_026888 [Ficus carica]
MSIAVAHPPEAQLVLAQVWLLGARDRKDSEIAPSPMSGSVEIG